MSGGQLPRVARGRAIGRNPKVICMDEPLSTLGAKLRVSTHSVIVGMPRRLGITTLHMTRGRTGERVEA
jgi:sn-glycerol 3-phosphate transport system ATP-binding protein/multiple sugar transport system ATP-binding protein